MAKEEIQDIKYIGVPFSGVEKHIPRIDVIGTREDECLAIAVGCFLCGEDSLVFLQNSGLGNCIDILTSLLKPYKIEIKLLISQRHSPAHHKFMFQLTPRILEDLGYRNYIFCDE